MGARAGESGAAHRVLADACVEIAVRDDEAPWVARWRLRWPHTGSLLDATPHDTPWGQTVAYVGITSAPSYGLGTQMS